jgi:hypothetical protein
VPQPCGVRPSAIGSQQPPTSRPRCGPTGRRARGRPAAAPARHAGAFAGYRPVAAGWNSQVAKPLAPVVCRRRAGRGAPDVAEPLNRPVTASSVASSTRCGRLSTFDTVPVDTPAARATSTSFGPGRRAAPFAVP